MHKQGATAGCAWASSPAESCVVAHSVSNGLCVPCCRPVAIVPLQHMDAWLELLVRQSCLHAQPSIASAAFQQLHALCQADTALQRTRATEAAQRGEPFVPEPPRLRPAIILGPILQFFDEPSLFGVDKERVSFIFAPFAPVAPAFLVDLLSTPPSLISLILTLLPLPVSVLCHALPVRRACGVSVTRI